MRIILQDGRVGKIEDTRAFFTAVKGDFGMSGKIVDGELQTQRDVFILGPDEQNLRVEVDGGERVACQIMLSNETKTIHFLGYLMPGVHTSIGTITDENVAKKFIGPDDINVQFMCESTSNKLMFKKLVNHAIIPESKHATDAGYDLYSKDVGVIPAHGKGIVKTGIAMALPRGTYGRIAPRSSVAWKNHIDVGAGVIDENYRGEIGIVLFNHGYEDYEYEAGERVAQLIIETYHKPEVIVLGDDEPLDTTDRGAGGFGSTGK